MSTALLPPGRTTYRNPRTFVAIVMDLIKERNWQIKVKWTKRKPLMGMFSWEQEDHYTFHISTPCGSSASGSDAREVLIQFCQAFVREHGLPIAYDTTLGSMAGLKEEFEKVTDEQFAEEERAKRPQGARRRYTHFTTPDGMQGTKVHSTSKDEVEFDIKFDPGSFSTFHEMLRKQMEEEMKRYGGFSEDPHVDHDPRPKFSKTYTKYGFPKMPKAPWDNAP